MAPHEFVEIRLVCKADYLDPQLKIKLHEIRDKLRQLLHTGRRRFALKKVQPWNSIKVTFDIPKEAADRLRLLAIEGNIRLIDLGIISVEIVGQSNTIPVNNPSTTTNSKELTASSSINSSPIEKNSDDHRSKRIKIENDIHRHGQSVSHSDSTTILNGNNNSWTGYKMKINGVHYYPSQQTQKYETNISSSRSNTPSTTNYFLENSSTDFSS